MKNFYTDPFSSIQVKFMKNVSTNCFCHLSYFLKAWKIAIRHDKRTAFEFKLIFYNLAYNFLKFYCSLVQTFRQEAC